MIFFFSYCNFFLHKSDSLKKKCMKSLEDDLEMLIGWIMEQCCRNSESQVGRNKKRARLWRRLKWWDWRRFEYSGEGNSHSVARDHKDWTVMYWKWRYTTECSAWEDDFFFKLLQCLSPHNFKFHFHFTLTDHGSERYILSHVTRKRNGCKQPSVEAIGLIAQHKWISFISYHILWPTFLLCESLVLNWDILKMVYA